MRNVFEHLSEVIDEDILTMFKPDFRDQYTVTIICRNKVSDKANIFVSSDSEAGVRSAVDHAFSPAAVEIK